MAEHSRVCYFSLLPKKEQLGKELLECVLEQQQNKLMSLLKGSKRVALLLANQRKDACIPVRLMMMTFNSSDKLQPSKQGLRQHFSHIKRLSRQITGLDAITNSQKKRETFNRKEPQAEPEPAPICHDCLGVPGDRAETTKELKEIM